MSDRIDGGENLPEFNDVFEGIERAEGDALKALMSEALVCGAVFLDKICGVQLLGEDGLPASVFLNDDDKVEISFAIYDDKPLELLRNTYGVEILYDEESISNEGIVNIVVDRELFYSNTEATFLTPSSTELYSDIVRLLGEELASKFALKENKFLNGMRAVELTPNDDDCVSDEAVALAASIFAKAYGVKVLSARRTIVILMPLSDEDKKAMEPKVDELAESVRKDLEEVGDIPGGKY